jgi:hypothetical protein
MREDLLKTKKKKTLEDLVNGQRFMLEPEGFLVHLPALEGRILIWR